MNLRNADCGKSKGGFKVHSIGTAAARAIYPTAAVALPARMAGVMVCGMVTRQEIAEAATKTAPEVAAGIVGIREGAAIGRRGARVPAWRASIIKRPISIATQTAMTSAPVMEFSASEGALCAAQRPFRLIQLSHHCDGFVH